MWSEPKLVPLGEQAYIVRWSRSLDPAANAAVHALRRELDRNPFIGLIETVPSYAALTVMFDPIRCKPSAVIAALKRALEKAEPAEAADRRFVEIPTVYGGDAGPDLASVAEACGLTEPEVAKLHSGAVYTVAMIGFLPGFPYLFGLPAAIATPRKDVPRTRVPAGSVGIAGLQTGIYPLESPGGWQIIGRTDSVLFDPKRKRPNLLEPGDRVRFVPEGRVRG